MIDHTRFLDEMVVRRDLKRACEAAGGQAEFARRRRISKSHIAKCLSGMAAPNARLCAILGFERCPTLYQRLKKEDAA